MDPKDKINVAAHHEQLPLCNSRPQYRQGRTLKSVKTYSISDESQFLIANGIPDIDIVDQFEIVCSKYGNLEQYRLVNNYPVKTFEKAVLIKYSNIINARFAKKRLDNMSFYGGILHVFYAPEYESVEDTEQKLQERRKYMRNKIAFNNKRKNYFECKSNVKKICSNDCLPVSDVVKIGPQLYPSQIPDFTLRNLSFKRPDPFNTKAKSAYTNNKVKNCNSHLKVKVNDAISMSGQPAIESLSKPVNSIKFVG